MKTFTTSNDLIFLRPHTTTTLGKDAYVIEKNSQRSFIEKRNDTKKGRISWVGFKNSIMP